MTQFSKDSCHLIVVVLLLFLFGFTLVDGQDGAEPSVQNIEVAKWEFHEFRVHITVMLFLLVMILIKIAFHRIPYVAAYVPESFLLIVLGIIFGAIIRYGMKENFDKSLWSLTPQLFFRYLLPPIILESSYSLYNRTFSEYLGVVLIFAVLGTIFNFLIIGFFMYGMVKANAFGERGERFDLKGLLLFSSLIVAVDPVAVLAIFQDIGVELSLYYVVFGESLLNDAITVVLYNIMSAFAGKDEVSAHEIGLGIASFITVSFGGLLIGVIIGIVSCLITRLKSHLNSFTLILLAYFSYIMADMVGWSGIISMIGCGLMQAAYAFHNLDRQSVILVHQLTKVVAEICESVIFLYLGIEVVGSQLEWHTGFILWALFSCLLARAIVVLSISAVLNAVQVDGQRISFAKQLILIYGGLRGAVAFSLALLIVPQRLGFHGEYNRNVIITATLFIILVTVGVMGMTMKPLVRALKIRMQAEHKLSLFAVLNNSILDETLAGIEIITHTRGRNVVREFFIRLDEKYIRRILQREPESYDHKLLKVYERITLQLHHAAIEPEKVDEILRDIPDTLKHKYLAKNDSFAGISSGDLTNLIRYPKPDTVPAMEAQKRESSAADLAMLTDNIRSTRRATLIPNDKRQIGFHAAFRDIMESKNRSIEITQRARQPSLPVNQGQFNEAFALDETEEEKQPGTRRKSSTWSYDDYL